MKHPLRWVALAVGAVVAIFAVILAVNVGTDPRADLNTSRLLGKSAPDFSLARFDGTKVRLADLAGKTVIVNFWNSWCRPCREELPVLQQWYREHRTDDSVVMLGIPRDDSSRAIRDAARADQMEWAVANDQGAKSATLAYATRGQPESFVISPRGRIVGSVLGPLTPGTMDQMVQAGQQNA
ncbi:MAG: TlpA family protein disulfide reductase [Acidimicrobiia bacterium]|nr:TlpA family protein disulfide reductase [Acidimicrobiia bacterium]